MLSAKRVVCFFAHTDDEMVCAGTLHRMVREGADVSVIAFAYAATQQDRRGMDCISDEVHNEFVASMNLIGVRSSSTHPVMPSCDFQPHRQSICQRIFDTCITCQPDVVFSLSPDDENTAHRIVGEECERVTRGRVATHIRCQFPWNFSLGRPNLYVTLSEEDLKVKADVIRAYKSQGFRYNYLDMLMAQTIADGLSVKVPAAEKFELIRSVI